MDGHRITDDPSAAPLAYPAWIYSIEDAGCVPSSIVTIGLGVRHNEVTEGCKTIECLFCKKFRCMCVGVWVSRWIHAHMFTCVHVNRRACECQSDSSRYDLIDA